MRDLDSECVSVSVVCSWLYFLDSGFGACIHFLTLRKSDTCNPIRWSPDVERVTTLLFHNIHKQTNFVRRDRHDLFSLLQPKLLVPENVHTLFRNVTSDSKPVWSCGR